MSDSKITSGSLTKREFAKEHGMSLRTVERYCAKGWLRWQRWNGETVIDIPGSRELYASRFRQTRTSRKK